MHVAVDLAILDPNEHGLTTSADAEKLSALPQPPSPIGRLPRAGRYTVKQGQAFGTTAAPVGEQVIEVVPQAGQSIDLGGPLFGTGFFSDHDLGNENAQQPFETGWRKNATVTLTGSGAQVRLVFALVPI